LEKYYSVDRFEGKFAVCIDDNGNTHNIYIRKLPQEVEEGDIIVKKDNKHFYIDIEETKKRREEIAKLSKKLFEDK